MSRRRHGTNSGIAAVILRGGNEMHLVRTTLSVLGALGVVCGGVTTPQAYSSELALLVGSQKLGSIARYDGQTGASVNLFVPPGVGGLGSGCGDAPLGLLFGSDGNFYVASGGATDKVLRYDGQTGAFIDTFVANGSGGLDQPGSLAFGPDGNLYVSSTETDSILRYDGQTGAFIDAFVASGNGGLDEPYGLVFGPDGNLYVCSSVMVEADVLRFNGQTGAFIDVFALGANFGLFENVALEFGPDGKLYVTSAHPGKVVRYDGQTGAPIDVFVSPGSGGLGDPTGLRFGPDGNLYLSEYAGDSVLRYDGQTGAPLPGPFGDPATAEFVPAGSGGLDCPWDLVFAKLPPPLCPPSTSPEAETLSLPEQRVSVKNRFLSFTAGEAGRAYAIRVTFVDLPSPFNVWNDAKLWVGPTSEVSENGGSVEPIPNFPNFNAARLQCAPYYTDWSEVGTVHVLHEGIIPLGSYRIQAIDSGCVDLTNESNYSLPLDLTTAKWGDTLEDCTVIPCKPPDGVVRIIDVVGILDRFRSTPDSIRKARADLEPGCLDLVVKISDVLFAVEGFRGFEYPFVPSAADPCDSTCGNPLP
jgi:streptogramin lyase